MKVWHKQNYLKNAEKMREKSRMERLIHPEYRINWLKKNPDYMKDYSEWYRNKYYEKIYNKRNRISDTL